MSKIWRYLALGLIALLPLAMPAAAQRGEEEEAPQEEEMADTVDDVIVVTASRTEQRLH